MPATTIHEDVMIVLNGRDVGRGVARIPHGTHEVVIDAEIFDPVIAKLLQGPLRGLEYCSIDTPLTTA